MTLSQPLVANAPIMSYEARDLMIVQCNSLVANSNPNLPLKTMTLASITGKDDIEYLIRQKYPEMVNLLLDLAKCEAGWRHDGLWGDNYQSYGVYQFQKKTFYDYCPSFWNWQDAENQLDCAVIVIRQGLGPTFTGWYNCWRIENLWKYEIK